LKVIKAIIIIFWCLEEYRFIQTHTLSHGLKYIHHHTNVTYTPRFWGSDIKQKNAEKSREPALRRDTTLSPPSKKSPSTQACGGFARLRHSSDCSKPVHNHFLKNLYWTRSQPVSSCSLP